MLTWGINFVVVKSATATVPPVGFAFLRFTLAGLVLLALVRWREGSVRWPPGTGLALFLLGGVGFGVYQILWATGLRITSAGTSSILIAASPIFTALVTVATGFERGHPARFAGAGIALAGVALVAAGHGLDLSAAGLGDVLTIIAACCWGFYLALSAPYLGRLSPLLLTTWAIMSGAIVLAGPGVAQLVAAGPAWLAPAPLLAIVFSGLLAGALANIILFRSIAVVGPSRIATFQFLVPVLAVILGALLLGETIVPLQAAGGLAIVAGIVIARRAPVHTAGRDIPEPSPIVEA